MYVLQKVLDWANRIDAEGMQAEPPSPSDSSASFTTSAAEVENRTASAQAVGGAKTPVSSVPMVRVPANLLDESLRVVGESMILTEQVQERVQQTRGQMQHMHQQFLMLQQLGHELEQLIDLRDISTPRQRLSSSTDFDPLELDQYNELHTCSRRLVEAATDARVLGQALAKQLSALDDMLVDQGRLNRENQEAVLQTRMVTVRTILPRLQRSVRQTCRVTGKSAELYVSGDDTMVDSDILSDLVDPLMHVLRNAVDHGVETSEERVSCGKSVVGRIDLSFQREGNTVVVQCRDDGRGLDLELIRRLVMEQGIIEADELLTDAELRRLILEPSFSTRTDVTQVSGRGIGMSAVYSQVIQLGGALNIESELGNGCVIEMRLPVTLISTHALLVRVQRRVIAISNRGIEQILHAGAGEVREINGELVFSLGEEEYSAYHLEHLVGVTGERRRRERKGRPTLLVKGDTATCAVLVEDVINSRDLVIKNLGKYVPKLRGVAGATILGDGSIAPVLDLPELLRAPAKMAAHVESVQSLTRAREAELPTALVVDDSLSARRSLAQFMQDSGFNVRTARDGLEAIEVLQGKRPDLLLVDLEMPRMNGLELTSHVRARSDTKHLPIIMITSRSTQKHRTQAESAGVDAYMTKPFAEEQLLEHIANVQRSSPSPAVTG
jgi:chemosensory pili system protein ChpA (sensor histidine kinase/response regulator)